MFCTLFFCYVPLELETLNTIRNKDAEQINFLLIGQKKINTSIFCYLHMYANSTYQYFLAILHGTPRRFSTPRTHVGLAPPHSTLVPLLKSRTQPRPPVCCACPAPPGPVSALKTRHPLACHPVAAE